MGKETLQALSKLNTSESSRGVNDPRDLRVDQRWKQLYELEKESGLSALQYLFLTNAGGSAATLAFIGTIGSHQIGLGAKIALGFFVSGVILSGISRAKQFHHLSKVFRNWRNLVTEFRTGEKTWEEINDEDERIAVVGFWDYAFPYSSFGCFIVGSIFGFITIV